ncbi:DUF6270 domain-containing protein [Glutamicibacter arilaitensis]|uniref:SGNH/GDSL hydrolase family protein n=1 Tax=Glutamicibacter arilaitensis TaxID=256701 RepID=A0A4Y8TYY4_9MICC|nr:DUF6270 domain-containing protein [Glutamicibacter arilaitensis]TFH57406.1 hypothetical protein EXY26_10590 [Glutamicibacter arilaitensis]
MKKIFLYGGCVIRDAYELVREDIGLSGYIARQSLISAMYPPTTVLPSAELPSAFQARMANGDIQSNLYPTMRRKRDETDLYVMDFHVERLGVQKLPDGSFVTRSSELMKSKVLESIPNLGPVVRIGSKNHTIAFRNSVNKLARRLEMLEIKDKVLIINAPWAEVDDKGEPFGAYRGKPVCELSGHIEALTQMFADNGVKVATMPKEVAVADAEHKWMRAPFHYGAPAMQWVAAQFRDNL